VHGERSALTREGSGVRVDSRRVCGEKVPCLLQSEGLWMGWVVMMDPFLDWSVGIAQGASGSELGVYLEQPIGTGIELSRGDADCRFIYSIYAVEKCKSQVKA